MHIHTNNNDRVVNYRPVDNDRVVNYRHVDTAAVYFILCMTG